MTEAIEKTRPALLKLEAHTVAIILVDESVHEALLVGDNRMRVI